MFTMIGRLPGNFFASGRYRNPEIVLPSNVCHLTNCGSAKVDVFSPPVSLVVQRSRLFNWLMLSEKTSEVDRAEVKTSPRSRLFLWKRKPPIRPVGMPVTGRYFRLATSIKYSLLIPSSLVMNASDLPSSLRSNVSTDHLISELRYSGFRVAR